MNAEAFALDFKFRQTVLCKERKEIAQFVHRKLLLRRAAWLVLLMATASAITAVTLRCASSCSSALRLSLCLLRSFFACGLCCAFLVAHSLFNSKRGLKLLCPFLFALNKAKSLNRPVGVSADGQLRLAASGGAADYGLRPARPP